MKKALVLLAIAAAIGAGVLLSRTAGDRRAVEPDFVAADPAARAIDTYLSRAVPFGYSGSALVARGGKILLQKGYGLADERTGISNTAATVHPVGSVTKQFTAAAIMKLWMLGELDPQDELRRFFPRAPPDKASITLHQLLTHTAGITNYTGDDYQEMSREKMLETAFAAPLEFPPGTQYRYSNAGYSLLAAVIEIASKTDYEHFLRDQLLLPAGLEHTGYRLPNWNDIQLARAYVGAEDKGTNLEKIFPSWNIIGNGEILSTPADMMRWHVALGGETILSAAAKEKLYTPNLNNYAYGWNIRTTPHGRLITHNGGSDQGTGCEYRRYDDAVIILFANRDSTTTFFAAGMGEKIETFLFNNAPHRANSDQDRPESPDTATHARGLHARDLHARDLHARDLHARDLTARDLTARDLTARDLTARDRNAGDRTMPTLPPEGEAIPAQPTTTTRYALDDGSTFDLTLGPKSRLTAIGRGASELLAFAPNTPPADLADLAARTERAFTALLAEDDSILAQELQDAARLERWKSFFTEVLTEIPAPRKLRITAVRPSNREIGDRAVHLAIENETKSRNLLLYFKTGRLSGLGGQDGTPEISTRLLARGPDRYVGHDLATGATIDLELRAGGAELVLNEKTVARRTRP